MTPQYLRELLHYDPETGEFTWLDDRRCGRKGRIAGAPKSPGYIQIMINGKVYLAHRLAWLYSHEKWPENMIDHIDGNKSNNRLSNLRDVTPNMNMQNQSRPHVRNKTGFLGVHKIGGMFQASIHTGGKGFYLGRFTTPEEAQAAYQESKKLLHEGNIV